VVIKEFRVPVGGYMYGFPAGLLDPGEDIAMVFAEVEGTPSIRHNEDSEDIEVFMMDREEVRDLLDRNDIVFGARAWLAMDTFVRMGTDYFNGN
jgi:ADP-ribose diphosphatase